MGFRKKTSNDRYLCKRIAAPPLALSNQTHVRYEQNEENIEL